MREPRDSRSSSTRAVPFQAALLVFLAGLATAAYFVEFRGAGFAALAAAETAPELVIVGGALLALTLVAHLSVSRALMAARGEVSLRSMLRQALTLADAPVEEIQDDLEALPSELQDLVAMLTSQRDRIDAAGREVQSLRHEMNTILQGMQRSALSLEPMQPEGTGEASRTVATVWNQMLERVQSQPAAAAAPSPADSLSTEGTSHLELLALRQRMESLESRCSHLEDELRTAQASPATPSGQEPTFSAGAPDLLLGAAAAEPVPQAEDASPWQAPAAAAGEAQDAAAEPAPASPSGYHEWTGHASAGDWKLQSEAQEALGAKPADAPPSTPAHPFAGARSGAEDLDLGPSEPVPAAAEPFVDDTYSLTPEGAPPADPASGEFPFPHFVGKPVGNAEGRVEVTFDGNEPAQPPGDPELPVDPDGSASRPGSVIFDLRSLGAVELDK